MLREYCHPSKNRRLGHYVYRLHAHGTLAQYLCQDLRMALHLAADNDNYNRREYVVKVLIKVVEGYTVDDAAQVMEEAHASGVAMVLACPQDEAEKYCEGLRGNGLCSSIEPGC